MTLIDRIERRKGTDRRDVERPTAERRAPWIQRAQEGRLPVADKTPERAS